LLSLCRNDAPEVLTLAEDEARTLVLVADASSDIRTI
jgi:hypothetical protein